ncbi:MAG: sialate O-acetylesterase [Candidatus Pedobacter colombiensis]|uniref:Sialate O-acetylesterase n=1 Tax=Candidatus Pedobacter colombiensis TaxID=3121371 RepID=A0AAJ6B6F6_9SPHI|nr:sialate O-acetylesterase [Pedobacter sp.]WEK19892.1 MAG: sialate O-acetylesterase [Pedobacter sp.]
MKKWLITYALMLGYSFCPAQIKLPRLISDGMILQRDNNIKIWGWASANEAISLKFKNRTLHTSANKDGEWEIQLPAQKAGGPYEMTLTGRNKIILKNILFGDVYVCSGQSNMELPMGRLIDKYPNEIAKSNHTNIRQFLVPDEYDFKNERKDLSSGTWEIANPETILNFSAVAYFFALEIVNKHHIPVGIINTALGGSPAEAWISESTLKKFPMYSEQVKKFKDDHLIKQIESSDRLRANDWYKSLNANDEGLKNNWKANIDDKDWNEMNIPGYWAKEPLGRANGVVWFKKDIIVPKSMLSKPVKLLLGRIVDADSVFINGEFVGTTSYQYPPRRYIFNTDILKEGKNTITIRLINNAGEGGFVPDKNYQLIANQDTIDLRGKWKYKLGAKMDPAPSQTFIRWKPAGLYNAMIAPLLKYKIKGVVWYQGESNTSNPKEYAALMKALIDNWRIAWNQGDFPFLYVQLPNFMEATKTPMESSWAELREQQRSLTAVPNTAMAVTIDLGEWNDIHPLDKQNVGKRLALQAEHLIYGDNKLIYSGPVFKSMESKGNQLILTFSNIGAGLTTKGNSELKYFAIAGKDKIFVWAKAEIKGDKIVVWSNDVENPKFVRYAWANNPKDANLYNRNGMPASPFEAALK